MSTIIHTESDAATPTTGTHVLPNGYCEYVLDRSVNRFTLYPIKDHELWSLYRKALACFWVPGEIDLSRDVIDWKTRLNQGDRTLITYVLAFFASSDGIVNENLAARFMQEVTIPEARCFYGFQIMIENIHAETYADMISTLVELPEERDALFNAIQEIDCVKEKATWALKWSEDLSAPFAIRLAAFAAVEGIFFSSSFAVIFWMKSRGLMPGLTYANELISRDEGMHQEFACRLFSRLVYKPRHSVMISMITEAVNIEKRFVKASKEAIPVNLAGMNHQSMSAYIESVADRLLNMLGYPCLYNTPIPFEFMDLISLQGKANFFERQVSSYRIANVGGV